MSSHENMALQSPLRPADSMMQMRTALSGICSITAIWVFLIFFSHRTNQYIKLIFNVATPGNFFQVYKLLFFTFPSPTFITELKYCLPYSQSPSASALDSNSKKIVSDRSICFTSIIHRFIVEL